MAQSNKVAKDLVMQQVARIQNSDGRLNDMQHELLLQSIKAYYEERRLANVDYVKILHPGIQEHQVEGKLDSARTRKSKAKKALDDYYSKYGQTDEIIISIGDPLTVTVRRQRPLPSDPLPLQPVRSSSGRRYLLVITAILLTTAGIILGVTMFTKPTVTSPKEGTTVNTNRVAVTGQGGKPWLFNYLIVEPKVTKPPELYVQRLEPLAVNYLSYFTGWESTADIGNENTADQTLFELYVFSSSRELVQGKDFETNGLLKDILPPDRLGPRIRITLNRSAHNR